MMPGDAHFAEAAELRARADAAEAEGRRLNAQERDGAIVDAFNLYCGSHYTRALDLASDLKAYAANGWQRECVLENLPVKAPSKRRALHRVLRSREGKTLGWRQIYKIAEICNMDRVTLQKPPCESRLEDSEVKAHEHF
jgi:hypothetical protein